MTFTAHVYNKEEIQLLFRAKKEDKVIEVLKDDEVIDKILLGKPVLSGEDVMKKAREYVSKEKE